MPDVVLLDWNMPVMNGLEMLKELRAEGFNGIKVMMVTTEAEKKHVVEALMAGTNDYLLKPFAFGELLARRRGRLAGVAQGDGEVVVALERQPAGQHLEQHDTG